MFSKHTARVPSATEYTLNARGTKKPPQYIVQIYRELFTPETMTQYTIKAFMLESVHMLHHDHLITFQCFKANPQTG